MKMRTRKVNKIRCCRQGWFESTGFLARGKRNKENRRSLRERYLRGDLHGLGKD
jgi:hypothetical protein